MSRNRLSHAPASTQHRASRPKAGDCPLCGARGVTFARKEGVALRRCDRCGVALAWAWRSEVVYSRLYTAGERYHADEQIRQGMHPHLERFDEHCLAAECRIRALWEVMPSRPAPAKLLDIGAGTGAFVHTARRIGFDARGLEPNEAIVRGARERGIPLIRGSWRKARGRYHVITVHDVIEHLTDPIACLRHLRRRLSPDGLLVLETPEWMPERTADWKHFRPREHVCLYGERSLRELARRSGLDTVRVTRPVPDKIALYAQVQLGGRGS
jgi:2-polyprenyl-3-methyl-5-hydroxy-6-metoxy-1,4-benzoquinol methylase